MKVLFVFHHADLTGAALLLYSTVKWLHENTDVQMSFLLRDTGVLSADLKKLGVVYEWDKKAKNQRTIFERIKNKLFNNNTYQKQIIKKLDNLNFDIIYYNTILCSDIINRTIHFSAKKIWHIHELELAINTYGASHLEVINNVDYVIANSISTKVNLVNHGFDSNKINVIYPFINFDNLKKQANSFSAREKLNIPPDAFVIGTSGTVMETKGAQSFLSLASILNQLQPKNNFYFLWIGNFPKKQRPIVEYDVAKSNINDKIIFTGAQTNPFPYYASFDVFVSTSKEESFGLSVVESAYLYKPIVCFKNTGGIEEIVSESGNITVDYLNVYQMALEILKLYKDASLSKTLGNKAHEFSKLFDTNVIMPEYYCFLKQAVNK